MSQPRAERGARLALLSETLLVGVYVLVGSLLVVTLPAALAAGVAYLRRHVEARDTSARGFVRDWRAAVGQTWVLGLVVLGVALVVGVNRLALVSGAVPDGGGLVWPLTLVAAVLVAAVVLRAAGLWSAPASPGMLVTRAWAVSRDDVAGTALLAAAVGLTGVLLWMLPALVVIVGGLLSLAVVGVEARRTGVAERPED